MDEAAPEVTLERAVDADLPAVVALMNRAYRAEGSAAGWTTETSYIDGQRTSEALLLEEMADNPAGLLLVWRSNGGLSGCVRIEPAHDDAWYLGSLTIEPHLQAAGHGRALLEAAESAIRDRGGAIVEMTVVNARDTLIAWYLRRGYRLTGEIRPFPYGDERFGVPRRNDLHFVVLSKPLSHGAGSQIPR